MTQSEKVKFGDLAMIAALLRKERQERKSEHKQVLDTLRVILEALDSHPPDHVNTASILVEHETLSQNDASKFISGSSCPPRLDPETTLPLEEEAGKWKWFKRILCLA